MLACDLDRSYFGRIERGRSNVGLVQIHRLAEGLKVKAAELVADRRERRPIFWGYVGTTEGMRQEPPANSVQ